MDIERLKEFILINETGSFKKAAEDLGISPSVLSSRFKNFETTLGASLLTRNNQGIELTENGKFFLKKSMELVQSWDTTKAALKNLGGLAVNSLKIQLCAQTMPSELGPFLDHFSQSHPQLFLDLYDDNKCTISEGLLSGTTDIVFTPGDPDDFNDIEGRVILSHHSSLYVHIPVWHRLSKLSSITFEDLSDETFILYPAMTEMHIHNLEKRWLERSDISYHIYDNNSSPIFSDLLVPIGKGIQFWNWTMKSTPNTIRLALRDPGYETCFFMLYNPDNSNPVLHEFMELFLAFRKDRI